MEDTDFHINDNLAMKKTPARKKQTSTPLAENLKRILKERNISMRVAAGMADVSVSTMSDWLSNSSPSDLSKVNKLAKGLNVNFSWLVLGAIEDNNNDKLTIEDLYDSVDTPIEGIFRISAQRLVKKQRK